jgi:hypothetical protein
MRLLITCGLLFAAIYPVFTQGSDDFLAYKLRSAAIKNFAFSDMFSRANVFLEADNSVYSNGDIARALSYPGFGYSSLQPEFEIEKLPYFLQDTSLDVYKLTLKKGQEWEEDMKNFNSLISLNKSLHVTLNAYNQLNWSNSLLLAWDGRKVIYLGGFLTNNDILYLFDVDWNDPHSLVPYLSTKYYGLFDTVCYATSINNEYIFRGLRKQDDGGVCLRRHIVVNKQTFHTRQEYLEENTYNFGQTIEYCVDLPRPYDYNPVELTGFRDKRNFLFDALMKNMFTTEWHKKRSQRPREDILSSSKEVISYLSEIDEILPNFDEYLKHFEIVSYPYCPGNLNFFGDGHTKAYPIPVSIPTIYDQSHSKKQVGYIRENQDIEFYRIMVSKPTMLFRKKSSLTTVQIDEWTVEGEWYRYPTLLKDDLDDKYTLGSSNLPTMVTLPVNCETYGLSNFKMEKEVNCPYPFDYYLLALNKKTREVYFISGPDILLSECVDLYNPAQFNAAFIDWDLSLQLSYIQDRLYQYQIPIIVESEHIQSIRDDKMLLRIPGVIRGKPVMLSVEINLLSPEDILVIVE